MPEAIPLSAAFFLAGWAAARLMLPGLLSLIAGAGFLRPNYRGDLIPCGAGAVFYLSLLTVITGTFLFLPGGLQGRSAVLLAAISGYTFLGLADDVWGSGESRGISGHLRCLLKGKLTTGSLKALAGGAIALLAAASGGDLRMAPLDALVIALSVNMVNLLDLRPGRAGKGFILTGLALAAAQPLSPDMVFLAAAAGALLAYLPQDLEAGAMMGDTGSNALGAVLGLTAAWTLDFEAKALYLAVLALVHLLAEKYSLTGIIASNRVLDYLDRLGRK